MMIPLFAAHLPVIVSPMLLLTAGPQPQPQYAVAMQTQREPHSFTNPQYANPTAYTEYYAKDTRPLIWIGEEEAFCENEEDASPN